MLNDTDKEFQKIISNLKKQISKINNTGEILESTHNIISKTGRLPVGRFNPIKKPRG